MQRYFNCYAEIETGLLSFRTEATENKEPNRKLLEHIQKVLENIKKLKQLKKHQKHIRVDIESFKEDK